MESITVNDLFCTKNRRFKIPEYQRSYSWGERQINQFIEDLKNTANKYYLGHFLFEESENEKNTLLIIDGQQRLTTCVIFFSCILKELRIRSSNGETISLDLEDIEDYYIRDLRKSTQKFETVSYDNNFFSDEIIGQKTSNQVINSRSKERILNAKKLFEKELIETETEELIRWSDLVQSAAITMFIVEDKIQAAQIFAFQNDRGKPLSNLEILKSYFMLQMYLLSANEDLTNQNIQYLERTFTNIYERIVSIRSLKEDDVLNYYWRAVSGKGYSSEEIIKGVKKTIKGVAGSQTEWIKDFIVGLSLAFDTVYKVEQSNNSSIKDLKNLNNMALSYPFLIKSNLRQVSEKTFNRLARLLENVTFRSLLRGGRADVEARLNWHLIHFSNEDELNIRIDDIKRSIKIDGYWWYWTDNQMVEILKSSHFYKNRVDNYLLWKYEMFLCGTDYPMPHKVSFNELISNESIEHIAPQNPPEGDNGYGEYEITDSPMEGINSGQWLHSVGNLMLMSQAQNSSLGNKPFSRKLETFGKDNLLNQQKEILKFVENISNPIWDKKCIERRLQKIIDAAMQIWDLSKI